MEVFIMSDYLLGIEDDSPEMKALEAKFAKANNIEKDIEFANRLKQGQHIVKSQEKSKYINKSEMKISEETSDKELTALATFGNSYASDLLVRRKEIRNSILEKAKIGIVTDDKVLDIFEVNRNDYLIFLRRGLKNKIDEFKNFANSTNNEVEKEGYLSRIEKLEAKLKEC